MQQYLLMALKQFTMKTFHFLSFLLISSTFYAQVGIGTTAPHESTALHIESENKGILIPTFTNAEKANITNPANGLIIYNETTNSLEVNTGNSATPSWGTMVVSHGGPSVSIYALGKVNANGTAAAISNASVVKISTNQDGNDNQGDYQITFDAPLAHKNYVIQLSIPDCGGRCPSGAGSNDDPGITYYEQTPTGFRVNIGDNDNGGSRRDDFDSEFMFTVFVIN